MAKKRKKKMRKNKPISNGFYAQPVRPDDEFRYTCSLCGDCCRRIKESVMVDSLDVYRIARYFKQMGQPEKTIEHILTEYAVPMKLNNLGYPIFLLKTVGADDACVFLEDGKCSIQQAKPRACRLYPLSAGPNDKNDGFDYFIVSQKRKHFAGPKIRVGDWMDVNFDSQDREFTALDCKNAAEINRNMVKAKISGVDERRILSPLIFFMYFNFNVDEPFLPQYVRNIDMLKSVFIKGRRSHELLS